MKDVTKDAELKELYFTGPIALSAGKRKFDHSASSAVGGGPVPGNDPSSASWNKAPQEWSKNQMKKWRKASSSGAKGKVAKGAGGKDGNGKGGKDGNGKGKAIGGGGGAGQGGLAGSTLDGRRICFTWNNGEHCAADCGMLHVCRIRGCYNANHPMVRHGAPPAPATER